MARQGGPARARRGETYRTTAARIYHAVEGGGRTVVGDAVLEWRPKDIFVVPAWHPHRHEADEESVLNGFSDKGIRRKLGLCREQRGRAAEA